ncbi:MAG: hypothetical protein AAF299_06130 [Pseudomonadota bacterium]
MTFKFRKLALVAATGLAVMQATVSDARAQGPVDDEADPVFVFNKVCYSQVPSIGAIRDMATRLAWQALEKTDLKPFSPDPNPEVLEGWDVQVGKNFFRLGVVRTAVSDKFKQTFPDFADGTATSCTLVLDGASDAVKVSEGMQKLAGKEPASKDVPDGEFRTTTWAGGNENYKVFLISKAAAAGETGLLNVTILAKAK